MKNGPSLSYMAFRPPGEAAACRAQEQYDHVNKSTCIYSIVCVGDTTSLHVYIVVCGGRDTIFHIHFLSKDLNY